MKRKGRKAEGKFVRTTITVPAELKASMDGVEEPVNWSQLAAGAFAARLEELAALSGSASTLEAMARRLRGARRQAVDPRYERGWDLGRAWAYSLADLDHLVRLERLYRTLSDEGWVMLASPPYDTAGDAFLDRLCPDHYGEPSQRRCFWRDASVAHGLLADVAFVRGFFEAALDAWLRVKGEVGVLGWWCPACAARSQQEEPRQKEREPASRAERPVKRKPRPAAPEVQSHHEIEETDEDDAGWRQAQDRRREANEA